MTTGPAAAPVEQGVDLRKLSPADAARLLEIVLSLARHGVVVVARRGPFLALRLVGQHLAQHGVPLRPADHRRDQLNQDLRA